MRDVQQNTRKKKYAPPVKMLSNPNFEYFNTGILLYIFHKMSSRRNAVTFYAIFMLDIIYQSRNLLRPLSYLITLHLTLFIYKSGFAVYQFNVFNSSYMCSRNYCDFSALIVIVMLNASDFPDVCLQQKRLQTRRIQVLWHTYREVSVNGKIHFYLL